MEMRIVVSSFASVSRMRDKIGVARSNGDQSAQRVSETIERGERKHHFRRRGNVDRL